MDKPDHISVREYSGTYIARWRGKTATCTMGPEAAARAVARKILVNCQISLSLIEPGKWKAGQV